MIIFRSMGETKVANKILLTARLHPGDMGCLHAGFVKGLIHKNILRLCNELFVIQEGHRDL